MADAITKLKKIGEADLLIEIKTGLIGWLKVHILGHISLRQGIGDEN